MWISKEGDVRKQELLDAALQLFTEKGYEGTSINDIIKKVGVTKGAFYYYFKSKEEVLDILTERQTDIIIGFLRKIAAEENVSVIEKLNRINADAQRIRAANMAQRQAASNAYRNEYSIILGIKIIEKTIQKGAPDMQSIIEQGIREGVFHTDYPREAAAFYMQLHVMLNDSINKILLDQGKQPELIEKIRNLLMFYEDLMKKLLGIETSSLTIMDEALSEISE